MTKRNASPAAKELLAGAGIPVHTANEHTANDADRLQEQLEEILKSMKYEEYLKTRHWRELRKYVIRRRGKKCSLCGAAELLDVHHKTYDNRGREHFHLDDLIVLCRNCHGQHHKGEKGNVVEEVFRKLLEKASRRAGVEPKAD
jgi:DNA repair exonuclease SbcCD ATPase subunit